MVLEVGPNFLEGMRPVHLPTHPQVSSPQGPAWGKMEVLVALGALPSTHTHSPDLHLSTHREVPSRPMLTLSEPAPSFPVSEPRPYSSHAL